MMMRTSGSSRSGVGVSLAGIGLVFAMMIALTPPAVADTPTHFNVRDYGAAGDGETNDAAAIREAIEAAAEAGGGVVYLPAGTYRVTEPINVEHPHNVSIKGDGRGSTRLDGSDIESGGRALGLLGRIEQDVASPLQISRVEYQISHEHADQTVEQSRMAIRVDHAERFEPGQIMEINSDEPANRVSRRPGRSGYYKEELAVIQAVEDDQLILENILYHDYDLEAYEATLHRIEPVRHLVLRDFSIEMGGAASNHWGILVDHFTDCLVENVEVKGAGRGAIRLRKGMRGDVVNSHVKRNSYPGTGYGIYYTHVHEGLIHGNHGTRSRHSIEVSWGRELVISDNVVKGDTSHGISTHGGGEYVTISGNRVHSSGGGIRVRGRNAKIVNNSIRNVLRNQGINVGEAGGDSERRGLAGHNLTITGNTIENVYGIGIYIYNELVNATIQGNRIVNWAQQREADAMTINGFRIHNTVIADNIVVSGEGDTRDALRLGPAGGRIDIPEATLENLIIRHNIVQGPSRHGINLMAHDVADGRLSRNILIDGNILENVGDHGVNFARGLFEKVTIVNNKGNSGGAFINGVNSATPLSEPHLSNNR